MHAPVDEESASCTWLELFQRVQPLDLAHFPELLVIIGPTEQSDASG
jgi:hypothetical protein